MTSLFRAALLLLLLVAAAGAGKDFYGILGVPKGAAANVIKRAYRKLSLQFHPDKAKGDKQQAEQKFVEISKAYEVLSDPKKRQTYDQHGEEGLKQMNQGGGGMNPFDVFRNFGFGAGAQQQQDNEGPALAVDLKVSDPPCAGERCLMELCGGNPQGHIPRQETGGTCLQKSTPRELNQGR